jgi:hypothetical protein
VHHLVVILLSIIYHALNLSHLFPSVSFIPVSLLSPEAAYHLREPRDLVNAMLYVLRSGCPWRALPHDLPAWGIVYYYFRSRKPILMPRRKRSLAS